MVSPTGEVGVDLDALKKVVEEQKERIDSLENDLAIANGALRLLKESGEPSSVASRRISQPVRKNRERK